MLIFKCDKLILHHEYNLITFKLMCSLILTTRCHSVSGSLQLQREKWGVTTPLIIFSQQTIS